MRVTRIVVAVVGVTLPLASVAAAQVPSSIHDLQPVLHGGERLVITNRSGGTTTGKFLVLSDQSLRMLLASSDVIEVAEPSIAKIEHIRSRTRRGALLGLIGGAALGGVLGALAPCDAECPGPLRGEGILLGAGIMGGLGAGIGAAIGAMMSSRHTIYLAATGSPEMTVRRLRWQGQGTSIGLLPWTRFSGTTNHALGDRGDQ